MTSTLKLGAHRAKAASSPFETADPDSPGPGPRRRTARRWDREQQASPEPAPGSVSCVESEAGDGESPPRELSNVEVLVNALRDPPDAEQRIRDYDWYMHYHTDELLNGSTVDVKDVEKYVRASELASGAVPEDNARIELPQVSEEVEIKEGNVQYYENWLHAEGA